MGSASLLSIMVSMTPANVHENVSGVILLLAVSLLYLRIVAIALADAACFDCKTIWIIRIL